MAERLVRKGFRVVVVEQTETPDQLQERIKRTKTKDRVVMREKVAVLSKGLLVDMDMLEVPAAPRTLARPASMQARPLGATPAAPPSRVLMRADH